MIMQMRHFYFIRSTPTLIVNYRVPRKFDLHIANNRFQIIFYRYLRYFVGSRTEIA